MNMYLKGPPHTQIYADIFVNSLQYFSLFRCLFSCLDVLVYV